MKRQLWCLFLLVGLAAAPYVVAKDYLHPKLKAKEVSIRKILLLPADVDIAKHGVKGTEGMGKESEEAEAAFARSAAAALTKIGFSVEAPFTEEALREHDELRYAVSDVQKKFDAIAPQLFKKRKDLTKGRFSIGDSVANLNTKGDADALLIVRALGSKQTKGKAFMTGGLAGMAMSGTPTLRSRVALVDCRSGDILFLADVLTRGLPKDKTFEKSFSKIRRGK